MLVSKAHASADSFRIRNLPGRDRMPPGPFKRFGSHSPSAQRSGDRGDAIESHQPTCPNSRGKGSCSLCLYGQDGDVRPADLVHALQQAAEETSPANRNHYRSGPYSHVSDLVNDRGMALPNSRIIKGMDIRGIFPFGQLSAIGMGVVPGIAVHNNRCPFLRDQILEPSGRSLGHNDSDRNPDLTSGTCNRIARVAGRGAHETARAGLPTVLACKANASSFERSNGLECFHLQMYRSTHRSAQRWRLPQRGDDMNLHGSCRLGLYYSLWLSDHGNWLHCRWISSRSIAGTLNPGAAMSPVGVPY